MTALNTRQKLNEAAPILWTIAGLLFIFTAGLIIGNMLGMSAPVDLEHAYTVCLNGYNLTSADNLDTWTTAIEQCQTQTYGADAHE